MQKNKEVLSMNNRLQKEHELLKEEEEIQQDLKERGLEDEAHVSVDELTQESKQNGNQAILDKNVENDNKNKNVDQINNKDTGFKDSKNVGETTKDTGVKDSKNVGETTKDTGPNESKTHE